MDGWMDGRTDGRTDGCMDVWMDGGMYVHGCLDDFKDNFTREQLALQLDVLQNSRYGPSIAAV